MVEVRPYSPTWPDEFAVIVSTLRAALSEVPILAVEHVGSTSVPDLPAKPIIDIDIVVPPTHLSSALSALASAGYVHRGDLGVAGREALAHPPLHGEIKRNIYVCVDGPALRNHLAVRDVLRSNAELRDAYGAVKLGLAAEGVDIGTYVAGKSQILQRVLRAAPEGTFSEAELKEILDINTR